MRNLQVESHGGGELATLRANRTNAIARAGWLPRQGAMHVDATPTESVYSFSEAVADVRGLIEIQCNASRATCGRALMGAERKRALGGDTHRGRWGLCLCVPDVCACVPVHSCAAVWNFKGAYSYTCAGPGRALRPPRRPLPPHPPPGGSAWVSVPRRRPHTCVGGHNEI